MVKHIKKIVNFLINAIFLFAISFSFVGCYSTNAYVEGLDKFSFACSSDGFGDYILPTDNFLEDYRFIDGNWYHILRESGLLNDTRDLGLMYLRYDEDTYYEVKDLVFSTVPLSSGKVISYNGYDFYANLKEYAEKVNAALPFSPQNYEKLSEYNFNENSIPEKFFYWGNGIAFNDEKKIFVSYYLGTRDEQQELAKSLAGNVDNLTQEEWNAYLTEFFPFYDFLE